MKNRVQFLRSTIVFCFIFVGHGVFADEAKPMLEIKPVKNNIYSIHGNGGNVGVFVGEEGTFVIDDKFAKDAPEIHALVKSVGGTIPKFLVNTHFHGDHSGGNEYFGEKGSIIVGHHNVHKRLVEGYEVKEFGMVASPVTGHHLPQLTYGQSVDIYLNGEKIRLVHLPHAHTDTDTIVYFSGSDVMHLGDTMFNGFFPFIDTTNGGSLKGVMSALEAAIEMGSKDTIYIPGHGPIASYNDVKKTLNTLTKAYDRLKKMKDGGATVESVIVKKPLSDIEKDWGGAMFTADKWITIVWPTL